MNCEELLEKISISETLQDIQFDVSAMAHLEICANCRKKFELQKLVVEGFNAIGERPTPASLLRRIMEIPEKEAQSTPKRTTEQRWFKIAFTAAFSVLVIFLFSYKSVFLKKSKRTIPPGPAVQEPFEDEAPPPPEEPVQMAEGPSAEKESVEANDSEAPKEPPQETKVAPKSELNLQTPPSVPTMKLPSIKNSGSKNLSPSEEPPPDINSTDENSKEGKEAKTEEDSNAPNLPPRMTLALATPDSKSTLSDTPQEGLKESAEPKPLPQKDNEVPVMVVGKPLLEKGDHLEYRPSTTPTSPPKIPSNSGQPIKDTDSSPIATPVKEKIAPPKEILVAEVKPKIDVYEKPVHERAVSTSSQKEVKAKVSMVEKNTNNFSGEKEEKLRNKVNEFEKPAPSSRFAEEKIVSTTPIQVAKLSKVTKSIAEDPADKPTQAIVKSKGSSIKKQTPSKKETLLARADVSGAPSSSISPAVSGGGLGATRKAVPNDSPSRNYFGDAKEKENFSLKNSEKTFVSAHSNTESKEDFSAPSDEQSPSPKELHDYSKRPRVIQVTAVAPPVIEDRRKKLEVLLKSSLPEVSEGVLDLNQWVLDGRITVRDRIMLAPPLKMQWVAKKSHSQWEVFLEPAPEVEDNF